MWISFHHSRFSGKARALRSLARSRGFTLVELLVVLAIITILSTIFIFQAKRFDSSTLLRSLGYSIALTIRQAQVYGTSVRQFGTASGSFGYSYGVYFATANLNTSPGYYYLFADVNQNKIYDSSPIDEKVERFTIGNGYKVLRFCATPSNGNPVQCSDDAGTPLTWLVIYFKRPNPDACFSTNRDSDTCNANTFTYKDAYIQIQGPSGGVGDTRSITVTSTGQISVGGFGT